MKTMKHPLMMTKTTTRFLAPELIRNLFACFMVLFDLVHLLIKQSVIHFQP
jgi:hypothetical protein